MTATGQEPTAESLAGVPEQVRDYLVGRQQWGWAPRFRELGEPTGVDTVSNGRSLTDLIRRTNI